MPRWARPWNFSRVDQQDDQGITSMGPRDARKSRIAREGSRPRWANQNPSYCAFAIATGRKDLALRQRNFMLVAGLGPPNTRLRTWETSRTTQGILLWEDACDDRQVPILYQCQSAECFGTPSASQAGVGTDHRRCDNTCDGFFTTIWGDSQHL